MYGYIYLTTNLVNGKMYVGKHKASEFNPEYKGSGNLVCRAFDKYGWDNFKVELLKECDSIEELNQSEINEIKLRDAVRSPQYYNIATGGDGWSSHWEAPGYREKIVEKFTGEGNPFYGHHHSEESIQRQVNSRHKKYEEDPEYRKRISEGQIGKRHTEETKAKMSVSISKGKKGKLPLNNGVRVIYRDPSEFDKYFAEGWVRGDLPRRKRTDEEKQRMREAVTGLITITNGSQFKRVRSSEVQLYLDEGWQYGRVPMSTISIEKIRQSKRGQVWINNGIESKMINPEDLDYYISLGYNKGTGREAAAHFKEKKPGFIWMNNQIKSVQVYPEEVNNYLSLGYTYGRIYKRKSK